MFSTIAGACPRTWRFAPLLAFLLAGLASAAQASVLVNGDFETPAAFHGLPPGWSDSTAVNSGPLNAPNVFVVKGADYLACCGAVGSAAAMDNHMVSFGAGDSANAGGRLGQRFATTAGQTYHVAFDYGALGISAPQVVQVTLEDLTHGVVDAQHAYTASGGLDLDAAFTGYGFDFTATGATTLLTFVDLSQTTNSVDAVLDNVSVTGAVPEPAAWALMLLGVFSAGAALRRRGGGLAAA